MTPETELVTILHECVYVQMLHTASRAGAGVTGLQGLLVATLAEIVGAGVDDDGSLGVC